MHLELILCKQQVKNGFVPFFFFLPQIYFERLGKYNLVSASCITVNIQSDFPPLCSSSEGSLARYSKQRI